MGLKLFGKGPESGMDSEPVDGVQASVGRGRWDSSSTLLLVSSWNCDLCLPSAALDNSE